MTIIFDATSFNNKTDNNCPKVITAYQQFIVSNGAINNSGIANFANQASAAKSLLVIDIETWPIDWNLLQLGIKAFRTFNPSLRLSWFGSGSVCGTMINQAISGNFSGFPNAWQINSSEDSVNSHKLIDFVAPSVYMLSTQTISQWSAASAYILSESKRWNKPVYPYISPYFSDNNTLIPENIWSQMIWNVVGSADGIIIWAVENNTNWDENSYWWNSVKNLPGFN